MYQTKDYLIPMKCLGFVFCFSFFTLPCYGQIPQEEFSFEEFNVETGFSDNVFYGTFIDSLGNVFYASRSGVYRFNKEKATRIYKEEIGYSSNIYQNAEQKSFIIIDSMLYKINYSNIEQFAKVPPELYNNRILLFKENLLLTQSNQNVIFQWNIKTGELKSNDILPKQEAGNSEDLLDAFISFIKDSISLGTNLKFSSSTLARSFFIEDYLYLNDTLSIILIQGRLIKYHVEKRKIIEQYTIPISDPFFGNVVYQNENELLICVNDRLFLYNMNLNTLSKELVREDGLPFAQYGAVSDILVDSYGNIHIVLMQEGLLRLKPSSKKSFKKYPLAKRENYFSKFILVDKSKNVVLSGSFGKGIMLFDTTGQFITKFDQFKGTNSKMIHGILPYKDGFRFQVFSYKYWFIINKSSAGEYSYEVDKNYSSATDSYYSSSSMIDDSTTIFSHWSNQIYHHDRLKPIKQLADSALTSSIVVGRRIYYQDGNNVQVYNVDKDEISAIMENRSTIFSGYPLNSDVDILGTLDGIFKFNTKTFEWERILQTERIIYSIVVDRDKNIWAGTSNGLLHIADNKITTYFMEDGLPSNEFNSDAVRVSPDGEIFMGTTKGMISFYPDEIRKQGLEPHILLAELTVNENPKPFDPLGPIELDLPHNENAISFSFNAMGTLKPSKYRYQYIMEGVNDQWIRGAQLNTLNYVLSPGQYTFKYGLDNEIEGSAKQVKSIEINIDPPFWRTWYFRAIVGLLIFAFLAYVIYSSASRRNQKKIYQLKVQNKLQSERQKLSRELHDNIGAQVANIRRSVEWMIGQSKDGSEINRLEQISDTAKNLSADLRDTIWVTNNLQIDIEAFSDRFKSFVQNTQHSTPNIKISYKEEISKSHFLNPEESLHLFRLGQESIHNAIKHSNTRSINIELHCTEKHIILFIQDYGNGFDLNKLNEEGNGISNMKNRAEEIAWDLQIESKINVGTEIKASKSMIK